MFTASLPNGSQFSCGTGVAILDAAKSAGVTLPAVARLAAVVVSKCKVLSGETVASEPGNGAKRT